MLLVACINFVYNGVLGFSQPKTVSFLSPKHSVVIVKLSLVSIVSAWKYVVLLVESITIKSLTEGG